MLLRSVALTLGLLFAGVLAPTVAGAQTDADLGCDYSVAPMRPGPATYTNQVRLEIRGCAYGWDEFDVTVGGGAFVKDYKATSEFECDYGEVGFGCFRSERHAGAGGATIRLTCPEGAPATVTLSTSGDPGVQGTRRVGEPKTIPCAPPSMQVLAPPARQSLRTAMRRGVVARFRCETACSAYIEIEKRTAKFIYYAGKARFRRSRGGTYTVRVPLSRDTRRRWRRLRSTKIEVDVYLTAASGEEVFGDHDVSLRR